MLCLSVAFTAISLLLAGRHGYYLDELYFRVAGNHLDWGYVDQPPLVALLARAQVELFGDTVTAIRVVPALCAGLVILLGAMIARELGGDRRGQLLAAVATGASAMTIAAAHILHTVSVDLVVWAAISWCVLRLLRTGDTRLWLAIGAIAGVGLLNKFLPGLLAVTLLAGLLLVGPRRVLASRHLYLGAGLALLVAAPVLVWQASHDWPQLTMATAMADRTEVRVAFVPVLLLLLTGPLLLPLWLAGLHGLLRRPAWRTYRCFAVAFLLMVVLLLVAGAQPRYVTGLLTVLVAAGAVLAADWAGTAVRRTCLALAVVGNAALGVVVMMPVLPVGFYAQYPEFPFFGDGQLGQVGWPELTRQVADVYSSLPEQDRGRAVVYAENYSQAGALDRYGPQHGLPPVYSAHNSYADFGVPGDDRTVVLAFGVDQQAFSPLFQECQVRGRFTTGTPVLDQGKEILVCRGPHEPWSRLWPKLRWVGDF